MRETKTMLEKKLEKRYVDPKIDEIRYKIDTLEYREDSGLWK